LNRPIADIENSFENLFDITKPGGEWQCFEDKEFYQNQMESKGRIGYATMEVLLLQLVIHLSPGKWLNQVHLPIGTQLWIQSRLDLQKVTHQTLRTNAIAVRLPQTNARR
jgi:hypothetical protein